MDAWGAQMCTGGKVKILAKRVWAAYNGMETRQTQAIINAQFKLGTGVDNGIAFASAR